MQPSTVKVHKFEVKTLKLEVGYDLMKVGDGVA